MRFGLNLSAAMFLLVFVVGLISAKAQSPKPPAASASPNDVFKFRLLGPTSSVRAKLSDERRWQTRDGVMLAGQALVSSLPEHVEIERVNHNGDGPKVVVVPLSALSDADQALLRSAMPLVKPEARRLGVLVPFPVAPQWSGAQPKIANRYTRAISVEPNQVIFRSGNELYAVAKTWFTPASYSVIATQFANYHAGRYVHLDGRLTSVFGKLLVESDSDFIFEAVEPPLIRGFELKAGQRFRLPKLCLSQTQIEDLQLIIKRFPLQPEIDSPKIAQLISLPCLRVVGGIHSFCEPDTSDPNIIHCLEDQGKKRRVSVSKLIHRDHLALVQERLAAAQPTLAKAELERAAFEKVAAVVGQRDAWQCAGSEAVFVGRLRGKLGDRYLFDDLETDRPFHVHRQQLSELDQRFAEHLCEQLKDKPQHATWMRSANWVRIFTRKLLINNGRALVVFLGSRDVDVNSAIEGRVPIVQKAEQIDYSWHDLELTNIAEIQRARKFVTDQTAILSARDLPKTEAALRSLSDDHGRDATAGSNAVASAKSSANDNANGTAPTREPDAAVDRSMATPLLALPKRDSWKLANSSSSFIGELVGQFEGDWVFEQMVNDERKTFLASPQILAPEAKRRGEMLLKRTQEKEWDKVLTRAHNWQYFRVWHDPAGKVRSSGNPAVVISISDSLIRMQQLDGTTSSNPVPNDEAGRQALVAFYEPAFEAGRKLRSRAEAGMTLWTFRDCEPTQRAKLIGESTEDILVQDARNVEFLINKACLDASSLAEFDLLRATEGPLRKLSDAEALALPRLFCMRTRLVGPAKPIYMTINDRLELLFVDGTRDFIRVDALTLRERLAYENQWRRFHGSAQARDKSASAKDAATVLKELQAEVADKDKVRSLPAVKPELVQAIEASLKQWQHVTWPSTQIALEADAKLLAINEDATFGVTEDQAQRWYAVELASGRRKQIRARVTSPQSCWMLQGSKVYWIEDGQIYVSGDKPTDAMAVTKLPKPIVAAAQSTDYSALVLMLSDASVHRLDLSTRAVRQLSESEQVRAPEANPDAAKAGPRLWASTDGTAYTAFVGNAIRVEVPKTADGDTACHAFLATNKVPQHVACNRQAALVQSDDTGSLDMLAVSASPPPPTRLGMPFNPRWLGVIKWQANPADGDSDVEKEVIQFIGKPADRFFAKANYFFVHQHRLDGDYNKYAYQYVQGELNEQMRVAANGAAIVHHRDGKYVVSRRPAAIAGDLRTTIYPFIRDFVDHKDIGQLEALGRLLEQPRFESVAGYAGAMSHRYQDLVKFACYDYQPQLGGDRLARAMALADHLWRKYPESQVAGNLLVDMHRTLAWSARGGGVAGTVTEAGWDSFRSEMGTARDYVQRLLESPQPSAPTFRSAIDVEMATAKSLEGPRLLATRLLDSRHVNDPQLQHAMAFMLLPRWHGTPGMSEAYLQTVSKRVDKSLSNEIYAQQLALLMPMLGLAEPVTSQLEIDLAKVLAGTKDYYQHSQDSTLLDTVVLILAVEQKYDWVNELLELRARKRMMPSAVAALHTLSFRNIEKNVDSPKPAGR